jgi:hypothetical protein
VEEPAKDVIFVLPGNPYSEILDPDDEPVERLFHPYLYSHLVGSVFDGIFQKAVHHIRQNMRIRKNVEVLPALSEESNLAVGYLRSYVWRERYGSDRMLPQVAAILTSISSYSS